MNFPLLLTFWLLSEADSASSLSVACISLVGLFQDKNSYPRVRTSEFALFSRSESLDLVAIGPSEPETRSREEIQRIIDAVRSRFTVNLEYLREAQALEFYIDDKDTELKSKFASLMADLQNMGDIAILRKTVDHGLMLMVFKKPPPPKPRMNILPLALFIATIIAVFADGVLRAYYYRDPLTPSVALTEAFQIGVIYTISLMGILGIHELGHKIAAWHHKMNATWPYFIPGIPSIWPTFGAVIRSLDPPVNRDALFDLGLSGPIAGLIVTFLVSIVAVADAKMVPISLLGSNPQITNVDYFTSFLINAIKAPNANTAIVSPTFSVLYFAYSLGFLLTFINLLPAWQLDGGHIANAAVSPRVHKWLTYVSAVIMILIGFWLMAILVLVLGTSTPSLRPLDDVSPLSTKRKVFLILTWILAASIYFFVIYNNAIFGFQNLL